MNFLTDGGWLNRMIHDKKLPGVCGETELANAKQSLITMMQVRRLIFSVGMFCTDSGYI
jgi:hypothetical protein